MPRREATAATFKDRIAQAAQKHNSRVVLALDINGGGPDRLFRDSRKLLRGTLPYICGLKLGRQTILNLGTRRTRQLITMARDEAIPTIVDDKLNDIDETNRQIVDAYFRLGLEGLTVNPFAGWRGGLESVFRRAHNLSKGVIVLVYMSHPGAVEGYGQRVVTRRGGKPQPQYKLFAKKALEWKADGVVVGATRPKIVQEVWSVLGNRLPIYSPGLGPQGGDLRKASRAGTDYFIIGRSITRASDPEKAAARYARESRRP